MAAESHPEIRSRGQSPLLHYPVGGRHAGDLTFWNQKGADSGSFLFAGMARSYNYLAGGCHADETKI